MAIRHYPALIENGETCFGAIFPDFPGCISAGATLEEAARSAAEALAGHVAVMTDHEETLPDPTPLIAIPPGNGDPDFVEACRLLVPVEVP